MNSIPEILKEAIEKIQKNLLAETLNDIGTMAKIIHAGMTGAELKILENIIEQMDDALVKGAKALRKEQKITVKERHVKREIGTCLGTLTYYRTYFQLADGTYAYLLDQMIGVESYERIAKETVAEILQKAGEMSYAKAAAGTAISKQNRDITVLVALKEVVAPAEKVRKTPEVLDVFADEDHVHLTPKGNAIVPLVTITEGMDKSNAKRHKTIHPLHLAEYGMETSAFSENVLAVLTERYDLDQVKEIRLHGDGGRWIQGLGNVLPRCKPVMDGYHIEKRIRTFLRLPGAASYAKVLRESMKEGNLKKFQKYCTVICERQEDKKNREHANEFVYHCTAHWDSITRRMGGQVCGSCTEAQVSHVLSERLSRTPLGWSETGLRQMTMLRVYIKTAAG